MITSPKAQGWRSNRFNKHNYSSLEYIILEYKLHTSLECSFTDVGGVFCWFFCLSAFFTLIISTISLPDLTKIPRILNF